MKHTTLSYLSLAGAHVRIYVHMNANKIKIWTLQFLRYSGSSRSIPCAQGISSSGIDNVELTWFYLSQGTLQLFAIPVLRNCKKTNICFYDSLHIHWEKTTTICARRFRFSFAPGMASSVACNAKVKWLRYMPRPFFNKSQKTPHSPPLRTRAPFTNIN